MTGRIVEKLVVSLLSSLLPLCVMAQDGYTTQTIISGNSGHDVQGVVGVNMASGDSNLQSNGTAVSVSEPNGVAASQATTIQVINSGTFSVPDVAVARIEGNAFTNASGALGINQAAGAANAQGNSVAIGYGSEVTADAELAQSVSGIALPVAMNGPVRETTIEETAFSGAHGVVQVNQSAGMANATGNSFTLRIQSGAP